MSNHTELINEAFERMREDARLGLIQVNLDNVQQQVLAWVNGLVIGGTKFEINEHYYLHVTLWHHRVTLSLWSHKYHSGSQIRVKVQSDVGQFLEAVES